MRVWRVNEWDHAEPTHQGTFATLALAQATFIVKVNQLIRKNRSAELRIVAPFSQADSSNISVAVAVWGETVTLDGEHVEGSDEGPDVTLFDLIDLQGLRKAVLEEFKTVGFDEVEVERVHPDPDKPFGEWVFEFSA